MQVIDTTNVHGVNITGRFQRTIKVLLAPDTQDEIKDFSITMSILGPHVGTDAHSHPIYELQYFLSGHGRIVIGDLSYDVKPDTLVVVPPEISHQPINESDEPMKILCIWSPAVLGEHVIQRALAAAK